MESIGHRIKRYERYVKYFIQWIFIEKVRGLDFTMRDNSLRRKSVGSNHGYAKTDEVHLRELFTKWGVDQSKKILDIGCGKGVVLWVASEFPFGRIGGLEIIDKYANIAKQNFKVLKLQDRVKIYNVDGLKFEDYGKYNVFYFFSPFSNEIAERIMERIDQSQDDKYWLVMHSNTYGNIAQKYNGKEILCVRDKEKGFDTHIYECNV